jgi:hypothetical protein
MYSMVLVICCRLEPVVGDRFPHIDPPQPRTKLILVCNCSSHQLLVLT